MPRFLKMAFWRAMDPLLMRMRSRLLHLEGMAPQFIDNATLKDQADIDATTRIYRSATIHNRSAPADLRIGAFGYILGNLCVLQRGARIRIGHHCSLGWGSHIWAQTEVEIGNNVLIAHLVDILDTNSHSLDAVLRRQEANSRLELNTPFDGVQVSCKPIRIEDDVWIGFKSSILKGVHIGKGAVIAAGSVVTKDVAPYTLVAGNPAVVVRSLV